VLVASDAGAGAVVGGAGTGGSLALPSGEGGVDGANVTFVGGSDRDRKATLILDSVAGGGGVGGTASGILCSNDAVSVLVSPPTACVSEDAVVFIGGGFVVIVVVVAGVTIGAGTFSGGGLGRNIALAAE
jgi:hypothetical protein